MGLLRCYSSSWWWSTNQISQGYSLSLKSFLPQGSTSQCLRVTRLIWCYSSLWWWSTNRSTQSYPLDLESILPYDLNAQCWRGTKIIWCYSSLWRWYPVGLRSILPQDPHWHCWRGTCTQVSVRLLQCARCGENVEKVLEDMIQCRGEDAAVVINTRG